MVTKSQHTVPRLHLQRFAGLASSLRQHPQATVANKPGHRGERVISRKTIARGMPDVSGVTVVTNACAYYTTHAAADAPSARHSLRPLMPRAKILSNTRVLRAAR